MNALVIVLQTNRIHSFSSIWFVVISGNSNHVCISELDIGFNLPALDFLWLKTKASKVQNFEYALLGRRQKVVHQLGE
jgi:hypothetical protein